MTTISTLRGEALKDALIEFDYNALSPTQEYEGQSMFDCFSACDVKILYVRNSDNYCHADKTHK